MARITFVIYSEEERQKRIARAYRRLQVVSTDDILVSGVTPQQEGEAGDKQSASTNRAGYPLRQSQLSTPSGTVRPKNAD